MIAIEVYPVRWITWTGQDGREHPSFGAQLKDHPEIWGHGKNPDEAVGSVIRSHPELFGLEVVFLDSKPRKASRVMITQQDLNNWFTYHAPTPEQIDAYRTIRDHGLALAEVIMNFTPASADQTAAIRKVREAVMTANAAIACGGK